MKQLLKLAIWAFLISAGIVGSSLDAGARHLTAVQQGVQKHAHERHSHLVFRHVTVDRSGRVQIGTASVYDRKFTGRRMAGGAKFRPDSDSAASKTLPLGTLATVKNLETGRTATVRIRDRGPSGAGRILDVSPKVAEELGMRENVVRVAVSPTIEPPGN